MAGLIRYLYGPGRREEHTDPHIIAGYRPPPDLEPPMRAAPDDRLLSDAEWAGIAADVMHRTGLCPRGEEDDAVRWIAIRHGPDHIHLVAMLARQDRARPRIVNERYRVRDACIAAEQRYGLRSTAPADRTAARSPSRAETGKAARHGRGEPPRTTLRRHVATAAASAASAEEFFARLDQAGILVRLRHSTRNTGQVTGYAVALPDDTTRNGEPVRYGGGKLAADLSWPGLAQRWSRPARPDPPLTPSEAGALWEYAARTAADATARIRSCTAAGNPAAAADAASAASDTLHTAAAALGNRTLRQAADDYDRAARQPWGRIPAPTPAGNQLRHAARLISAYAYLTGDRTLTPVLLLVRLTALAEAVAKLRESQQRATQATAALRAARHLRTATRPPGRPAAPATPPAPKPSRAHPATAAGLARLSFPSPPRPSRPAAEQRRVRSRFRTYRDLHDPPVAIPEEVTAAHRAGTAGTNKIPASCPVSYAACRAAARNSVRVVTRFSNPGCEKWFRLCRHATSADAPARHQDVVGATDAQPVLVRRASPACTLAPRCSP